MLENNVVHPTVAEITGAVEPCCAHCKADMEKEPWRTQLIREQCLFGTRVPASDDVNALSWD